MNHANVLRLGGLLGLALLACSNGGLAADAMDGRRTELLQKMLESPYPPAGFWHYENLALAAYFLGQNARGDEAMLQEYAGFAKDPQLPHFHWHAYILERIYFLFSSASRHFPGRMSPAAEKALVDMLWQWAGPSLSLEMTLPERDWWVWGSENHHLQAWASAWGAAHVLAGRPEFQARTFADGTSLADMARAFDDYFKRWVVNRAGRGLFVECNSGYNKYSIGPLSNLADFAEDPVLKRRMTMFLDLFWTDWAIEQLDGMRGGSRHRCYPGRGSLLEGQMQGEAWFLFGIGKPLSKHPSAISVATSFYRPPPLVTDLALHPSERGSYTYVSRRLGRGDQGRDGKTGRSYVAQTGSVFHARGLVYKLEPEAGDLLRVTWCTPDFILGTSMVPALPDEAWTGISSQNRWAGVIFGGAPTARIFAQPLAPDKGSVYNDSWSVQSKGVLILQRLQTATQAKGQRLWFDEALRRTEKDGWIFAEAPRAWAAVRVLRGATTWEKDDQPYRETSRTVGQGQWLACGDEFSPVILEVARKSDYPDLAAFQEAILANPLSLEDARLHYVSQGYKTALTLWSDYSRPPEVDGQPVNYAPVKGYDSPYLSGDFGGHTVTIGKGEQKLVLDFEAASSRP